MADTIDTTGQEPYEQCGYCHEYDGNSVMPAFPRLAGQTYAYIVKQLQDFRLGKRAGQMQATAELLSEEDIRTVARYFSQQPVATVTQPALSKQQILQAQRLIFTGDSKRGLQACVSCHGANTLGIGTTPRLAGQHADYLRTQLNSFQTGERSNDEGGQMGNISRLLTDQEITVLAWYLAQHTPVSKTARDNSEFRQSAK